MNAFVRSEWEVCCIKKEKGVLRNAATRPLLFFARAG